MKLVIGSDHAGFQLKVNIGDLLRSLGHELLDVGAFNENPSDYPDFAEAVGRGTLKTREDQADVVLAAAAVTGLAVLARAGRLKTLGLDEGALLERLEKHFTPVS